MLCYSRTMFDYRPDWSALATTETRCPVMGYTLYLSILIITIIFILKKLKNRRHYKLPPGPSPYPIIGNLNLMGSLPHRSIHRLSQKYGHIMQLQFGSFPIVVGSSVEAARFFLKTHDLSFVDRPINAAGKYMTYNYSDMTWSPYGAYWRQARKMYLMELFSMKRLDSYEYIRVQELGHMLKNLYHHSQTKIVLKDFLATLSLNVISRMVLGKVYVQDEEEEFKRMIDELFLLSGVLNIGDNIPWLEFLDLQGYVKRMKASSKKLDKFLEHVLEEHIERRKECGEKFVAKDMVDVLLQIADDPTLDVKLGRDGVKAFTQDLIAGGTESSTVTLEWAISNILKSPYEYDIFEKATEELDRVIGKNRWVKENDLAQLPYIESIVKETMRLHPVAPMLVPRLAREDTTFDGYDIPTGTRVLVNVWAIGRDPKIWEEPNEFKPERFMGKKIDVGGHHFELLPFGAGRRMCPGYSLGWKLIQMGLANMLHGFKWRLPDGMSKEELSLEEIFGLSTPKKDPLEVVAEPRLAAELYDEPSDLLGK